MWRPSGQGPGLAYGDLELGDLRHDSAERPRDVIEKGIAADAELARLTAAVRAAWVAPKPPKQKKAAPPNTVRPRFRRP